MIDELYTSATNRLRRAYILLMHLSGQSTDDIQEKEQLFGKARGVNYGLETFTDNYHFVMLDDIDEESRVVKLFEATFHDLKEHYDFKTNQDSFGKGEDFARIRYEIGYADGLGIADTILTKEQETWGETL